MAEVQVHLRKRYQCTTCPRSYSSRKTAEAHAAECVKDPATRACGTCKHDFRGGGYDEGGPCCEIGARPDDVLCVRHCDSWEIAPWIGTPAQTPGEVHA